MHSSPLLHQMLRLAGTVDGHVDTRAWYVGFSHPMLRLAGTMRISEGRKSLGAMFFLMRDCWRETAEPALLIPLEMDVALDKETVSFIIAVDVVNVAVFVVVVVV